MSRPRAAPAPTAVPAAPATEIASGKPVAAPAREKPTGSEAPSPAASSTDTQKVVQFTLQRGQSLYKQFEIQNLDRSALSLMVRQDRRIKKALRRLRPGRQVQVTTSADGRIQRLLMEQSGPRDLLIARDTDNRFQMREVEDQPFDLVATAATPTSRPTTGAEPDTSTPKPTPIVEKTDTAPESETPTPEPVAAPVVQADSEIAGGPAYGVQATDPIALHRVTVKAGDSLFKIFRKLGIPPQDLANLLAADEQAQRLKRLRPGQELALGITHDKHLHSVRVELDYERTLSARRLDEDAYDVEITHQPLERRVASASAVIENSLFMAGQRSGLSDRVIMELTEIFGWDVDFALDVRAGDRFTVIHEELYKDGEKVRDGPILASEFVNRGRSVRAIRFVDDTGRSAYFSPEGLSMRKAFLRTPVRFSRISSRFSRARMHPVLNRMRAHKGVDYAAPRGTAINATGDGRVIFAGRKRGYGRTVILQHGSTYTTLYAHMSRLHSRSRKGARVRQGDTIGYVGSSGLATGPHLHYEFRVRGRHVDPLRVKLPKALPIEARYKAAFLRQSRPLVSQLDTLAKTSLASRD